MSVCLAFAFDLPICPQDKMARKDASQYQDALYREICERNKCESSRFCVAVAGFTKIVC